MEAKKDRFGKKLWCGPTEVLDRLCVWRHCFNPHDCGYCRSGGQWMRDGRCLTRYHKGCPADRHFVGCCDDPRFAPIEENQRNKKCRSCGALVPVEVVKYLEVTDDGYETG